MADQGQKLQAAAVVDAPMYITARGVREIAAAQRENLRCQLATAKNDHVRCFIFGEMRTLDAIVTLIDGGEYDHIRN